MDVSKVDFGDCGVVDRRRMDVACPSGVPGTWIPGVHGTCPHNEVAAVMQRSLAPLPKPVDISLGDKVEAGFARLRRVARCYGGLKWSYLETAQSYSGSMRRKYLEAERSLLVDGPIVTRDSDIYAFLKAEKIWAGDKFPKPRLICPRSARYNLALASRLKPFEHWLWGYLTGRRMGFRSKERVVMKGLSPRQRANCLLRKFKSFEDCVVFEVDGKAFEAHVGPALIDAEHSVYGAAYPGDQGLLRLLRPQKSLAVRTPSGVEFSRPGGRASGDFNTGMGNSLIMAVVVVSVLRGYGVPFDVAVDGDNALIFLRGSDYQTVVSGFYDRVLECSGLELVLERPVRRFEEVRFGRSGPVDLGCGLGYTMVRDYRSVISGGTASHRWLREPSFARRWLNGVARCELSLAAGMPVLQQWALTLLRTTKSSKAVQADVYRDYFVQGAFLAGEEVVRPVEDTTRRSFHLAFGISPEEQVIMENSFRGYQGGNPTEVFVPDVRGWFGASPGVCEPWADERLWGE